MENIARCKKCAYLATGTCGYARINGVSRLASGQIIGGPCMFFSSKSATAVNRRWGDNQKRNEEIKRLFAEGKTDRQIGEAIGCSEQRANFLRNGMGLKKQRGAMTVKVFCKKSGDLLCKGTFPECAKTLGIRVHSLRDGFQKSNRGDRYDKYRFEVVR